MVEFLINSVGLPQWLAWTITAGVAAALILNVIAGGALVFIWAERKIAARIQDRLGPTRTGGAPAPIACACASGTSASRSSGRSYCRPGALTGPGRQGSTGGSTQHHREAQDASQVGNGGLAQERRGAA